MSKRITNLTHKEARKFFLSEDQYFTFDLPKYFTFNKLLKLISIKIANKNITDFYSTNEDNKINKPEYFENVNYKLFNNKNGEYSWRMFQLIHPAIYVSVVHKITEEDNWKLIVERLLEFKNNNIVECASIPVVGSEIYKKVKSEQILTWWEEVEQKSISESIKYNYIFKTDIVDCYGSIYTHAIPWAIHTKRVSKQYRECNDLLGNFIDCSVRAMSNGQTNGIPQGSVLMDFIAEIVLGYADEQLSEKVKYIDDKDFKIIRYRDDYRIFVNNPITGKRIIKELTDVLIDLGMRISSEKTIFSDDIISNSIKPDKLYWRNNLEWAKLTDCKVVEKSMILDSGNLQSELLVLNNFSLKYPNSGTLEKELQNYYIKIWNKKRFKDADVLVSIVTDIAFKNPRTYPISISILGKIISTFDNEKKLKVIGQVESKIKKLPNTEVLDLWLQRLTIKFNKHKNFLGRLNKKAIGQNEVVWNSDWLDNKFKKLINDIEIIDNEEIKKMDLYPSLDEILMFERKTNYYN